MAERIIILIDGQNTHAAMRSDGMTLNYPAMVAALTGDRYMVRSYFFSLDMEAADEYRPLRPLLDYLDYHGFAVVTKERGSIAVDLAAIAFDIFDTADHLILCTGDEQFIPLVEALQRRGVRVTIAASKARCADELRRQADHFIDLEPIRAAISRPLRQKEAVTA